MVKDLLGGLDYSAFAETALILFSLAFVAVAVAMAKVAPRWSESCAAIPLTDGESKTQAAVALAKAENVETTQ
jgi:hypothetical protein